MTGLLILGSGQPEEQAGCWQKLTFSYANGLIDLGYSQPLHQEHLWSMAKQNEAGLVASNFQAALAATKDPVKAPHVRPSCYSENNPENCLLTISLL